MKYDPYWDKVVLLMHFDGSDGTASFVDSTGRHTFTRTTGTNRPVLSNLSAKFGATALLCDDSYTGYIRTDAESTDFDIGSGPYTVELWLRPFAGHSACRFMMIGTNGSAAGQQYWLAADNSLWFGEPTGNNPISGISSVATPAIANDVWTHIAFVWETTDTYALYLNGVQHVRRVAAKPWPSGVARHLSFGADWSAPQTGFLEGMIDEVRFTKGVARYLADFTPPSYAGAQVKGAGIIQGQTMESSVPVSSKVRVYNRNTLDMVREVTSDANGMFSFDPEDSGPFLVVGLDDPVGTKYNAIVFDHVTPVGT